MRHTAACLTALVGIAIASAGITPAAASVLIGPGNVVGDRVVGQWESPVLSGNLLDGATRAPTFLDDTTSAVYSLGGSLPKSTTTLSWGDDPTAPPGTITESSITFTGAPAIPGSKATTDFSIGGFSYTNGSSESGSGIFGATLVLYAVGIDGNVPIGSIAFVINATINDGSKNQDADWLQVEGVSNTFQAFEGAGLSGSLDGIIVGDPMFVPHAFVLDPGQDGVNGFLGGPAGGVPELSTWAMLAIGFSGLGLAGYRGRSKAIAGA